MLYEVITIGQVVDDLIAGYDKKDVQSVVIGIDCSAHTRGVITSYSIHYTKLYDYQAMRDAAFHVMRTIKIEAGGSNIQFAVHPDSGEMRIIEMNPRVSRSSALASKATGFPIAKIAAMLAVGLVITSYSIHYTKLYEAHVRDGAPRRGAAEGVFRERAESGAGHRRLPVPRMSGRPVSERRPAGLASAILALLTASPLLAQDSPESRHRITSYNVCYTKLLRIDAVG